jgi:hypothetical protein
MMNLVEALSRMEYRLQNLVEGSLARIFSRTPAGLSFTHQLIESLQEQVQTDDSGRFNAPHTIVLYTDPGQEKVIRMYTGILDELSEQIEAAAVESGIYFNEPPVLLVKPDALLPPGTLKFQFETTAARPGTTDILPTTPGTHHTSIPLNAYLIVTGEQLIPLTQSVTNLGRRDDNDIVISDRKVSRRHAQIRLSDDRYTIFDLQSSGGTFVNGRRVHQSPLRPGDVISLAGALIVFGMEMPDEISKTQEYRPDSEQQHGTLD